jgi:hypothetical protein
VNVDCILPLEFIGFIDSGRSTERWHRQTHEFWAIVTKHIAIGLVLAIAIISEVSESSISNMLKIGALISE